MRLEASQPDEVMPAAVSETRTNGSSKEMPKIAKKRIMKPTYSLAKGSTSTEEPWNLAKKLIAIGTAKNQPLAAPARKSPRADVIHTGPHRFGPEPKAGATNCHS